jgi:hypothetical protein
MIQKLRMNFGSMNSLLRLIPHGEVSGARPSHSVCHIFAPRANAP